MKSARRAAILIGVLYIIGDLAGFASVGFLPSFAPGTDVLGQIASHRTATIIGALCVLTMGFALSALSAVFYPIGRRFGETLATGYVIFRGALEGTVTLLMTLIVLVLVALAAAPAGMAQAAGALATAHRVLFEQVIALPFVVGAAMFYWLLFRSRLVPRWISVWGLATAPLYVDAAFARMAGVDLDFLMFPLAIQEMVLAVWLIAKGFDAEVLASAGAGAGDRPAVPAPMTACGSAAPGRPAGGADAAGPRTTRRVRASAACGCAGRSAGGRSPRSTVRTQGSPRRSVVCW
jgi:hypothetical protein